MPILGALILPHGAMPFDGDPSLNTINTSDESMVGKRLKAIPDELRGECETIFTSCQRAVRAVKDTKPDVIFLNTPHGISLSNAIGVYTNPTAKGTAEWNEQWTEYTAHVDLDYNLSQKLIQHLQKDGVPVQGITCFSRLESPIKWGEVIPLWYLAPIINSQTPPIKVVIISNPLSFKEKSVDDLVQVGHSISSFLSQLEQRVLYVCSGDLAHTHETNCSLPLYLPSPKWPGYKTSETALPFDKCIENWVKGLANPSSTDGSNWQDTLSTLVPDKNCEALTAVWNHSTIKQAKHWLCQAYLLKNYALTCGFNGFCILHGILETELAITGNYTEDVAQRDDDKEGVHFAVKFFCRLAPTYYGMMAASFVKEKKK